MKYCHFWLISTQEYEKALPRATEAGQIREATCSLHPATARNLYFIGTLHEKIGDQLSKAGTNHNRGLVIIGHWTFA